MDSGASVSCIQKASFDKISKTSVQIQPSSIARIVGIGGERHQVLGQAKITLKISGLNVDQNFIIIEQLHHSLILGLGFMQDHNVNIDFHCRVMTLYDHLVAVALTSDSKFGYARSVRQEVIPAESELIPVKLSKCAKNEVMLLETVDSLQNINLAGAKCLIANKNNKAVMRLINPTTRDVTLSPTRVIANVNIIDNQEVYPFDDSPLVSHIGVCAETIGEVPNSDNFDFIINNPTLYEQQKAQLCQFLLSNRDVFSTSLSDIGQTDMYNNQIETVPSAKPVHQRFYRQDPVKKAETKRQTNEMLDAHLIQRSTSVWNSPVVLVKKKDGSWLFAVDYRKLNQIRIPISHPLPRIEDVLMLWVNLVPRHFRRLILTQPIFRSP